MKTETSLSFRNEDEQRKVALFTVLVCCLPSEECHFTWESDSKKVSYNHKILSYIANDWNIPTPYFETYRNLFAVLNSNDASEIDRKDILSAFIGVLIQMKTDLTDVLIRICIYLISNRFYSSRGRRLLRNLSVSFQLPYKDFIALEICISSVLKNYEDFIKKSTKKEKVHDIKRYAKIGAVSIGAGALLALTGGMAAPAIAAALLAVGGTTALTLATFSSVTIIASLLGSAGAGLAGYKMKRRTAGLQEFEFELFDQKIYFGSNRKILNIVDVSDQEDKKFSGGDGNTAFNSESNPSSTSDGEGSLFAAGSCQYKPLAVIIMVSGWMTEKNDYRRYFGVLPSHITDEERMQRFYEVNFPAKAKFAKREIPESKNDLEEYYDNITSIYGKDPRMDENIVRPAYQEPCLPPVYETSAMRFMTCDMASIDAKNASKAGKDSETPTTDGSDGKMDSDNSPSAFFRNPFTTSSASANARTGNDEPMKAAVDEDNARDKSSLIDRSGTAVVNTVSSGFSAVGQGFRSMWGSKSNPSSRGATICTSTSTTSESKSTWNDNDTEVNYASMDPGEEECASSHWDWRELDLSSVYELTLLKWDTDIQLELGASIMSLLNTLRDQAVQKIIMTTAFASLVTAVAWPLTLISLLNVIDSTWTMAVSRADEAGRELAHALLMRPQGSRPVTLVGHSMGARVICSCLKTLADHKKNFLERNHLDQFVVVEKNNDDAVDGALKNDTTEEAVDNTIADDDDDDVTIGLLENATKKSEFSDGSVPDENLNSLEYGCDDIVEDVILLGAPVSKSHKKWEKMLSVVSGRLINGYSSRDLVLSIIYRYEKLKISVAGVGPVGLFGVEDLDLSDIISKHTDYGCRMKEILTRVSLMGPSSVPRVVIQHII